MGSGSLNLFSTAFLNTSVEPYLCSRYMRLKIDCALTLLLHRNISLKVPVGVNISFHIFSKSLKFAKLFLQLCLAKWKGIEVKSKIFDFGTSHALLYLNSCFNMYFENMSSCFHKCKSIW